MTEIDHALTQNHAPGWPIRQPGALGSDLSREAKCIRCARAIDLQVRSGFPGESLCYIIRCRGKGPEHRVQLGEVVEPACKTPEMPCFSQA